MASISEDSVVELPASTHVLSLSPQEKQMILATTKEFVHAALAGRVPDLRDPNLSGTAEKIVSGAFVCLKRNGHLRGCCGVVGQPTRLIKALEEASCRTPLESCRRPELRGSAGRSWMPMPSIVARTSFHWRSVQRPTTTCRTFLTLRYAALSSSSKSMRNHLRFTLDKSLYGRGCR